MNISLPQTTYLPQNLWSFIWHFLKIYKLPAAIFILLAMITGLWPPLNSLLLKHMIDTMSYTEPDNVLSLIFWPAVFFVLNFEIHNLCWRGVGYINYKLQPIIKNQIIEKTFSYIHQHSHQFFQDNLSGRISSHIITLADNIEHIVHDISKHMIRFLVLLIVAFISMYYVHPYFFCSLLIWFIMFTAISFRVSKRIIDLSELHAAAGSLLFGQLVDSITNSSTVRLFARRNYEIAYIEKYLLSIQKTFQANRIFGIKLSIFRGASFSIMLALMLYFLIQLRLSQVVSIGDFALILGLSVEVGFTTWGAVEQIDELNTAVGKCKQSLLALFGPLNIKDIENASDLIVPKGEIIFVGVKFHYKSIDPLFQNISINIQSGQKVGLVGYSGSGKTTFVNLILRLYDLTGGHIFIDGQDIRQCTQDSLRKAIAMIPQDPSLFHRTLMENIRYGRIEATDEEVVEATKRAHAHEFIIKLPQGYESLVGERGVKLSGGQRQRIAIARAILKNAPILVLDEATSQLDSITEMSIQESLWELMNSCNETSGESQRTTIVIAHRLSTLLRMDRILVFDMGKIVEDGIHTELLVRDGLYRSLWDAQVGGLLPDKKSFKKNGGLT